MKTPIPFFCRPSFCRLFIVIAALLIPHALHGADIPLSTAGTAQPSRRTSDRHLSGPHPL
ncbi:MAG: hypothetical protein ACOYNN_12260 [Terrimicrobiaceae bacterium]